MVDLVPGPLGSGELDAALRRRILDDLPRTPFLPRAAEPARAEAGGPAPDPDAWDDGGPLVGEGAALRPVEAEIVEGATADAVRVLAEVLPTLLPASLERRPALRQLGVARLSLADAVDRLAGAERPAEWWWRLYDALAGTDADVLSGLPVPLADGRTVVGPRQVLLPVRGEDGDHAVDPAVLARLGLRVAHADAAHPLLEKLGAAPATPRAILTTPQVRAAVAASLDDDRGAWDDESGLDAEELADTVLGLARAAGLAPGDEPWLAALALPDEDGELAPAGELVLPGSPLESVLRRRRTRRRGRRTSPTAGANSRSPPSACSPPSPWSAPPMSSSTPTTSNRATPTGPSPTTSACSTPSTCGARTCSTSCPRPMCRRSPPRSSACATSTSWTTTPGRRRSPCSPGRRCGTPSPPRCGSCCPTAPPSRYGPTPPGGCATTPCSTAAARSACARPAATGCSPGSTTRPQTDTAVDEQVLRALGVRTTVAALLAEPGGAAELLGRLADPDRTVTAAQLHGLYAALAELDPEQVTLPDDLRAVRDGVPVVVDAADALVADAPDLLPLAAGLALLPVPPRLAGELAELFQVRRLSEAVEAAVVSEGEPHDVPARRARPAAGRSRARTSSTRNCCWSGGVEVGLALGGRGAARRHRRGCRRRARLGGGPLGAALRAGGAARGPHPHGRAGPAPAGSTDRGRPCARGVRRPSRGGVPLRVTAPCF